MSGTSRALLVAALSLVWSCKAEVAPRVEPPGLAPDPSPVAQPVVPVAAPPPVADGAPDPSLPIVGDPLGLLSRPAAAAPTSPARARAAKEPGGFDPGALMNSASSAAETKVELERDPRAVARALAALDDSNEARQGATPQGKSAQPIQQKSAADVFGSIRRGASQPHVLFLYAAYCPGCRKVMPQFLPLVTHYKARGVQFTAASVDRDPSMYENYAPVLGGVLPPVLIRSEGTTASEMRRAGLSVSGDSFSIPLVALFDRTRKMVMQGGSAAVAKLPRELDSLL
jgi:thiol-disulfide isomerase/thioredoxin